MHSNQSSILFICMTGSRYLFSVFVDLLRPTLSLLFMAVIMASTGERFKPDSNPGLNRLLL